MLLLECNKIHTSEDILYFIFMCCGINLYIILIKNEIFDFKMNTVKYFNKMLHCTTNNLVIGNALYYILNKSVHYHKGTTNKEKETRVKLIVK